jgi:hypothetical protein
MIRLLRMIPLVAILLAAAPLSAAPRPGEKPEGPAVVGQARSMHDLLEMTKTLVKNVAGDEMFKQFEQHLLPELDFKKVAGIDPKRPFGLYGILEPELEKCRGVLLIPTSGEKDFLDMLTQFEIPFNKGKEAGTFEIVTPPDIPFPIVGRFHKDYAYIAFGGADVLDLKTILDPKDVINDKEKAPLYLALRLDRVPATTKKALVGLVREHTDQLHEAIMEPELKAAFTAARALALRWLRELCDEGKELAFRVEADPKSGDVIVEMTVDGVAKSPLAEAFKKRSPTTNRFASLVGDDFVQRMYISAPLFADEAKEAIIKLIELAQQEAMLPGNAPPEATALKDAAFKSLKATYASGEMDLAAAIRGPNKEGFYTVVGAIHCKEGAQLEKAIREAVKVLPGQASAYFKFDASKIGDLSVHEIDLTEEAGDMAKAVFGKGQKGYFAFGKDALYASYGPDGMKLLKEAVQAKPGPAAVFDSFSDPKKAAALIKKMMPADGQNGRGAFGVGWIESMSMSGMQVTVEGGDRLKVKARINLGSFIAMGLGSFATEAKPVAAPAVAVPARRLKIDE